MIRLFRCDECDDYFLSATGHLTNARGVLSFNGSGEFVVSARSVFDWCDASSGRMGEAGVSYPIPTVFEADDLRCIKNQSHVVSVVELDECPHQWTVSYKVRSCVFCGETQEGRITFDD